MKGSEFVSDYFYLLHYKCHKINRNRGGSYIDSPNWIKSNNKSHQQKGNDCFQYDLTAALNHKEIGKYPEGTTENKPFIEKGNWQEINFPSEKYDQKKYGKNDVTIALIVLHAKTEKNILLCFKI